MSKLFKLVVQTPKLKSLGVGTLSVLNNEAYFFAGHGEKGAEILAVMHKPVLEFAGASSIKLTGIEPVRLRHNIQEYAYQEWFLHYLDGERGAGEIDEVDSHVEPEGLLIDRRCQNPCPFCGLLSSQVLGPDTRPNTSTHAKGYQVECINCGARGPCGFATELDAKLSWDNERMSVGK